MKVRAPWSQKLPEYRSTDWTYGWKGANLLVHNMTGEIKFAPIYQYHDRATPYGVDADARCQSSRHKAPHGPDRLNPCQCGFNAYEPEYLGNALDFLIPAPGRGYAMVTDNVVILWVGLAGEIYSGSVKGTPVRASRGEHQRVGLVLVPQACAGPDCIGRPILLGRLGGRPNSPQLAEYGYLRPLCAEHKTSASISLERCSERLAVPRGRPRVHFEWYDPMSIYR